MGNKLLKCFEVREDIFNKILYDFESRIETVGNFKDYIYGYNDNKNVYKFDGKDTLILPEYILNYYCDNIKFSTSWKQCQIRSAMNADTEVVESLYGSRAERYINDILLEVYNEKEIEECLLSHQAEYDEDLSQYHYCLPVEIGYIYKVKDTVKYDINGAHLDALCEIFPKAKDRLLKMYEKRKKDKIYKKLPNYYVGRLGKWKDKAKTIPGKYRKTYNWIVQRTTKKLFDAIDAVGGMLLYANTDGFLVKDPNNLLKTSKILGDFKEEFSGTTYIYRDKNYILYQNNDLKGSCLTSVRPEIDLSKGKVVHYDRIKDGHAYIATNITKETLNEKESYKNL